MLDDKKLGKLQNALSKKDINVVVGSISQMMSIWVGWYRGAVNDFHYYNRKNARGVVIKREKKTLSMAKKISEDWASMIMNENSMLSIDNEKANKYVKKVLQDNNFLNSATDLIEKTFAIGGGLITEYIDNGKVNLSFIQGDMFLISDSHNKNITAVCVVDEIMVNGDTYYEVTHHKISDGIYRVEKFFLNDEMQNCSIGSRVSIDANMVKKDGYYIEYETEIPFFQYIRPNVTNNYELNSPYGISIFANSIDTLKSCDNIYDGNDNEFNLSRKRVVVNSEVLKEKIDYTNSSSSGYIRYFDSEDDVYQSISMEGADPITAIEFKINQQEYEAGIKQQVSLLGFKCGLGSDYYGFDSARGVTATEVISRNSDTYRNKSKHERILKTALINMMKSIVKLGFINGDLPEIDADDLAYTVKFDDSIINDDEAIYAKDLIKLEKGIISKETFRSRWEPDLNSEEEDKKIATEQEAEMNIYGNEETEEKIEDND